MGIIGMSIYNLKRSSLFENKFERKIAEIEEEIKKLKEAIEQVKEKISGSIEPEEVISEIDAWKTYRNEKYKYEIGIPEKAILKEENDHVRISLPVKFPEKVASKYLIIEVDTDIGKCLLLEHLLTRENDKWVHPILSEKVLINEVEFYKGDEQDCGGGLCDVHTYYRTIKNGKCYKFHFTLSQASKGVLLTKDILERESSIYHHILSTLRFPN
jgi:hypothetical protein